MGEKGLHQALVHANKELPEGYHIEVVPDKNGVPRPIGVPDEHHYDVGPDGEPDLSKPKDPHLIWNEKLGIWIPV